ncbi:transglutaminase-like cysteine peptidase [Maritalea mediterranea]|uniref:Transglutaminase-like cysteine peptidase n=1 Tax=Maritalea mediterranea TaxID=2909667 RepID=A0ABS9E9Z2_9HYPH|nr:transglutaminase-like cysteine peptidase [Maritalea mediterranea]MCF4098729.1 transglutaminase-like cysteine peptidase [Maritalea mediterranea]
MKILNAKVRKLAMAVAALPALWSAPALAITENQAFVLDVRETSIPIGHAQFCQSRPAECGQNNDLITYETLTQAKWDELLQVNAHWNRAVRPINDIDLYQTEEFWTYPRQYGDCEDYVLAKRRSLIERGWAPSTLLITVVKQANGEGHAVLTVRTDRGDLILDNQEGLIKVWSETNYTYIKRQSQQHQGRWMELADNREVILASR